MASSDFSGQIIRMEARQIHARGVRDAHVLEAMEKVPREKFLPTHLREFAYTDRSLPIAEGQTISQPYMVEALAFRGGEKVIEIGAGSGYVALTGAAVLTMTS